MTFQLSEIKADSKTELYENLTAQAQALLAGERDLIANAANLSSLIYHSLQDVNWVGFYFLKDSELLLGPFQGKPACVHIKIGEGVCGAAAQHRQTFLVDNVHEFPGHIACDIASKSEIVVPIIKDGKLMGVLDLDSESLSRFDEDDAQGLNNLVGVFVENLS